MFKPSGLRFSIKIKLIILAVIISTGMISMLALQWYSLNKTDALATTKLLVSEIETGMLTLRRNEKDFLARNALKYRDKFDNNYTTLQNMVSKLKVYLDEENLDSAQLKELQKILESYKNNFTSLVSVQQKIGLNPLLSHLIPHQ